MDSRDGSVRLEASGTARNRIGRVEYLTWNVAALFGFLLLLALAFLIFHQEQARHHVIEVALVVFAYFKLAILIPRRLHDMNASGWWTLVFLLPLVDVAFEVFLLFKPGTRDANEYGAIPHTWPWEKAT